MQRSPELFIGLMSGTSLDGVDAVLMDLGHPCPRQLGSYYRPFSDDLKQTLLALHQPTHDELHLSQLVANELARVYAATVTSLLQQTRVANNAIIAIGCHGQTIRHCPEHGYTVQIGNAALLAELTSITVISDFRSRDIAAGGQGAPLVPAFHDKVFRSPDVHRVIVNIGGISNLTNLPPHAATSGFDCGPGNLLMDAWCMIHQSTPYDDNGAWAASGSAIPTLLSKLLSEPFFNLPPPKSSGRDLFNIGWLKEKLHRDERPEDVQATLLELTCLTIAQAIQRYCPGAKEVYLCGGGARNRALHTRLTTLLKDIRILSTAALGVDSDFLEAIAFAWLAQQTLQSKPANLPEVTGARHSCILGAIHRA